MMFFTDFLFYKKIEMSRTILGTTKVILGTFKTEVFFQEAGLYSLSTMVGHNFVKHNMTCFKLEVFFLRGHIAFSCLRNGLYNIEE